MESNSYQWLGLQRCEQSPGRSEIWKLGRQGVITRHRYRYQVGLYTYMEQKHTQDANSTVAGSLGAIAMELNIQESSQGAVGLWDTVCVT